ncbi:MAG TPA: dihydrolipoamide acetyltransferase family protein [Steroidobacteraceae bacterium]|jgi:2-oxoisovalerate dehydrogenase E2 component (dihydrolipoyl transacylase)|nr:dihydrolipoamide acetyltransferase family protein [Steroidobacteraceae bacterium]
MSRYAFQLPDLGEGTVCAEIVSWLVKPGDQVSEGQPIAEMSTEKAVVELPSPVTGKVISLGGAPGDEIAVGAELITFEQGAAAPASAPPSAASARPAVSNGHDRAQGETLRVRTSPATRRRAREAGIDLTQVTGTGPRGRIQPEDLTQALAAKLPARAPIAPADIHEGPATEEVKVIGVRRVIAQRMSAAKRSIPHFSYVEEIDVTELEALRVHLNRDPRFEQSRLTLLPFIVKAVARALERFPQCNALYDESRDTLVRHRAMHAGIATQTRDGLKVPVVRNAQALSLQQLSAEIRRVSEAARSNRAKREELSGSTITLTSLGKLGGIASTPVINMPEMAIIGVNRMSERAVVRHGGITVRQMMNLSSSFDHRFVDGFDAAAMIQAVKELLEHPATIFIET